ncbi:hypothetical protein LTR91_007505 [Friedmanniomyces endolithicus]|uniref:Methyltransferase domain-containing protein n=1 Tax=Friedmanniomyces endolithicus TaxID=329885 RepID=A0AAN6KQ24_9PEZI|nr:hypothetical protein LTR94_003415 [Friedmanniomyces endolithicus]KAK0810197.1 hypothetical protein LTR75_005701 [Friedmanniomyces endolithicus]KAK0812941.1 hypothetical protein LTR59_001319 [Friedmanniomyces endolithicus]KAK0842863.1 hypothetical protein LTR03_009059 [Friedmanniomyces endolithicus]KAK0916929.1 hypothetical protein LTR57_012792 [Friedmanniomyces endolithicus]
MNTIASWIDIFNFELPFGRWQLFEFCDLDVVPDVVKHCCQDTLTAQWAKRLPFIQRQSPAELAADAVLSAINSLHDIEMEEWTVIDFCSGAGGTAHQQTRKRRWKSLRGVHAEGPIPYIEALVNDSRKLEGKKPIPFRLSDLHPNLDAWIKHAALSDNLSFVPQPVDASYPPFSVISATTPGDKDVALKAGYASNGSKVFRIFCLSFHHFDDEAAQRVLKSTLETSDAFAIIELQDRRIGSLFLMVLEFWLVLFTTVFWFWDDWMHLLLTYGLPVLPAVHSFDGFVSCLRTRTFEETLRLIEDVQGGSLTAHEKEVEGSLSLRRQWQFSHARALHTWPLGYMEVIFGRRMGSE